MQVALLNIPFKKKNFSINLLHDEELEIWDSIDQSIILSNSGLVRKKCPLAVKNGHRNFPRAEGDVFKLLLLSDQQSKFQRDSIHNNVNQRKAANSHI